MNKRHLFIDTNNFIEPMEEGFKEIQVNLDDLRELNKLLKENKVTLLLPEVVVLESKRLISEKREELKNSFEQMKSNYRSKWMDSFEYSGQEEKL